LDVKNRKAPGDASLTPEETQDYQGLIAPTVGVLRLLGIPVATADGLDTSVATPMPSVEPSGAGASTLTELIAAGYLHPESTLQLLSTKYNANATLTADGRLQVDGEMFDSPSAAYKHVTGTHGNGWQRWGAASGTGEFVPLDALRQKLRRRNTPARAVREKFGGGINRQALGMEMEQAMPALVVRPLLPYPVEATTADDRLRWDLCLLLADDVVGPAAELGPEVLAAAVVLYGQPHRFRLNVEEVEPGDREDVSAAASAVKDTLTRPQSP